MPTSGRTSDIPGPKLPPRPDPDRDFGRRMLRNLGGILLLLAGIAGLVLPILQGWLMILIGLSLIDLPIKHQAHVRLLRYRWYQRLAAKHETLLLRWRAFRGKRKAR